VILDGDQLMALMATGLARGGRLQGGALVATVMSNLGLERYLAGESIALHRTAVGDRHVVETMRSKGCNLGGEQSGHIILADYATTGDGLIAALQVLASIVETGRPASEVCRLFTPVPQILRNVRFGRGKPLESPVVERAVKAGEARLGAAGRLVIRPSGTEPVIRVMAEGEDEALVATVVGEVCAAIRAAAALADDGQAQAAE
jgi:phosphoglucosamine mutase